MSLYARLGLNFDTSKFGDAANLSEAASNTLNVVANASGKIPDWQLADLTAGPINRANYYQNPTAPFVSNISVSATSLLTNANNVGDSVLLTNASQLIIELNKFKSHTDNISGAVEVANNYFPSLQSAQNMGQMNMLTLSKSDGVSNTTAILGSFTSLFIKPELTANVNQILFFANEYANSINVTTVTDELSGNTTTIYTSNLPNTEIVRIQSYLANTQNQLLTRRTSDWTFYQNSMSLAKDVAFMQQFSNMGGTMTNLVNNVVGTPSLISKLNS